MTLKTSILAAIIAGATSMVVNGAVASITVADGTKIDPITLADTTTMGINGSGWVAIVQLKGITNTNGTLDPSKLTITVQDPGFDTAGNPTTVNRTLTGTAFLRRLYPSGDSRLISTDGTDLFLYIPISGRVYTGTTILSASIAAGFYTGSVVSNATNRTNLSVTPYQKPMWSWHMPANQVVQANTIAVEGMAFHRHPRGGQQVSCVKYQATDGTNTGAELTVSGTSLSTVQKQGNIIEVWAGNVDISTLTNGVQCNVNAKVYPWIGDASAVLDLSTTGNTYMSPRSAARMPFVCDRTGAYGGVYAYVRNGASGGAASTTEATAQAAPFPTILAAVNAIKAFNNRNSRGANDMGGGIIRLMDNAGADDTYTLSANVTTSNTGIGLCVLEKDPASSATITLAFSAQSQFPTNMMFRNLRYQIGTTAYSLLGPNSVGSYIVFDGVSVDNTNNRPASAWYDYTDMFNMTLTAGLVDFLNISPSASSCIKMMSGLLRSGTGGISSVAGGLNCSNVFVGSVLDNYVRATATRCFDGNIIYNNRINGTNWRHTAANATYTIGLVNVQNIYESITAATPVMNYFADGDRATIDNYIEQHNTGIGERCSRLYQDVTQSRVSPYGLVKDGVSLYNLWHNYNIKSDTFERTDAIQLGCGNFAYMYSVDNVGNVSLFGDARLIATAAPDNTNGDPVSGPRSYLGNAFLPSSEFNLFRTALGFTQAQIMAMFTNYTAPPQASPALGGNYRPLSSAVHLRNRVPAGMAALKYDITGAARKNDGTGAAGAYEV